MKSRSCFEADAPPAVPNRFKRQDRPPGRARRTLRTGGPAVDSRVRRRLQKRCLRYCPALCGCTASRTPSGLLVVRQAGGKSVGQSTPGDFQLTSSDPKVVTVQGDRLLPVGDGEAVVTAASQRQTATAKVTVTGMGRPQQ